MEVMGEETTKEVFICTLYKPAACTARVSILDITICSGESVDCSKECVYRRKGFVKYAK